jgi:hypothetical protein
MLRASKRSSPSGLASSASGADWTYAREAHPPQAESQGAGAKENGRLIRSPAYDCLGTPTPPISTRAIKGCPPNWKGGYLRQAAKLYRADAHSRF